MEKDTIRLKKEILAAGLKKQQSVIDDFRKRINDMMDNEGNVNEEEYDNQVQSKKAEATAEVSLLADQLQVAADKVLQLRRMESAMDVVHTAVVPGAVVVTDQGIFFISVSLEKFLTTGGPTFGLSVHCPLYKCMSGKKAGEIFEYKNTRYTINQVF